MVKMLDELNNNCNIDIQSYLLLKAGLKPVIRVGLGRSKIENAKRTAKKLGLKLIIKEYKQLYGTKYETEIINAYFSFDKNLCIEAIRAERKGNRKKFGQLLGYPECCVDNFIKNYANDLILTSLRNVTTRPSFFCNNLFVFDSKIGGEDIKIYKNNPVMFNNPHVKTLFLIPHVPCSFDCKHSIEIGKITLKLLKNSSPNLATKIINALKRPVLYWNYFEWIIFNGHQQGNIIKYDGVLNYESLVNKETKKMIENGDNIKIGDERMSIFNLNEKTGEIPRKNGIPVCIDFQ